jgi:hypothetical protein
MNGNLMGSGCAVMVDVTTRLMLEPNSRKITARWSKLVLVKRWRIGKRKNGEIEMTKRRVAVSLKPLLALTGASDRGTGWFCGLGKTASRSFGYVARMST